MPHEISPEAIMAFALLHAGPKPIRIEDVSKFFFEVRQKGLDDDVERVALRRVPGGFYSDDVEAFLGRLLDGPYAVARSPVELTEQGTALCWEIVQKELDAHPKELRRVAEALGFSALLARESLPA